MSRKKTVLLTGANGFIAKHILLNLLNEGFIVRASLRDITQSNQIRETLSSHVKSPEKLEKQLSFLTLDLNDDAGWNDALKNCASLIHTASPFPMSQPSDPETLIRPAVDGTLRALSAAAKMGVDRVVLTSSVVAINNKRLPAGRNRYDESDWTDTNSPLCSAYAKSKTMAERAAWHFVREHPTLRLTTINPGLVLGPSLDGKIGTSLRLIERIMRGKDPFAPRLGMTVVDVRDIAQMHIRALQSPETAGNRYIGVERFMWMVDIARVLKSEFPDRKISTREAPDWLIKFVGRFDKTIAGIIPSLGHETPMNNTAACEDLGIEFIEARQAIKTSATSLIRDGIID